MPQNWVSCSQKSPNDGDIYFLEALKDTIVYLESFGAIISCKIVDRRAQKWHENDDFWPFSCQNKSVRPLKPPEMDFLFVFVVLLHKINAIYHLGHFLHSKCLIYWWRHKYAQSCAKIDFLPIFYYHNYIKWLLEILKTILSGLLHRAFEVKPQK